MPRLPAEPAFGQNSLNRFPTENQTRAHRSPLRTGGQAVQLGRAAARRQPAYARTRYHANGELPAEEPLTWRIGPSSVSPTTLDMNRISAIAIVMMITLAGGVRPERR
jgi:hypothetical protein